MHPQEPSSIEREIFSKQEIGKDNYELRAGDALLIIDLQIDFLPGGALPVPHGDEVIPVLNHYISVFVEKGLPIFATRDWHPVNHCSFKEFGGPWPRHCVVETPGAAFPSALALPEAAIVISKPSAPERETYSAFDQTDFAEKLRQAGVQRLFVGGLATDYCVLNTVKGALQLGFQVLLLKDAVRAVNVRPDDGASAEAEMIRLGAVPISREEVMA